MYVCRWVFERTSFAAGEIDKNLTSTRAEEAVTELIMKCVCQKLNCKGGRCKEGARSHTK